MRRFFKKVLVIFGYILGIYLIGRAAVEPFLIDYGDADSYRNSWGGPTVVGVILVHMLPGVISLILILFHRRKRLH